MRSSMNRTSPRSRSVCTMPCTCAVSPAAMASTSRRLLSAPCVLPVMVFIKKHILPVRPAPRRVAARNFSSNKKVPSTFARDGNTNNTPAVPPKLPPAAITRRPLEPLTRVKRMRLGGKRRVGAPAPECSFRPRCFRARLSAHGRASLVEFAGYSSPSQPLLLCCAL